MPRKAELSDQCLKKAGISKNEKEGPESAMKKKEEENVRKAKKDFSVHQRNQHFHLSSFKKSKEAFSEARMFQPKVHQELDFKFSVVRGGGGGGFVASVTASLTPV